jgi:hypothetical protein
MNFIRQWLIPLCLGFAFLFPASVSADSPGARAVDVGIYLTNIPFVNLKEKKFQADFYVWFRWKGDDINPIETFELVNGHIDSKDGLVKKDIGDIHYASVRVVATIYRNFVLTRYPLDNHPLKIQIEDGNASGTELRYRPDKTSSGISAKIEVPGWKVDSFDNYTSVTRYPTNYGDISRPGKVESTAPRYTLSVMLKRAGYGNFIKLFSILFLAAGLAFCAFRVRSDYIDARVAFAASAVFMAVITQSALSTNLPESDSFGMADQLYYVSMGFIVATFLAIIYAFRLSMAGQEDRANKLSRSLGWTLPVAYLAANVFIVASS